MTDTNVRPSGVQPGSKLDAAWTDIEERRRKDPDWSPFTDPTYWGTLPCFLSLMKTDAELENSPARQWTHLQTQSPWLAQPLVARLPQPPRAELPQPLCATTWTPVPFGQRLRQLRRSLGWTQGMAAASLGVSVRTVIRYERGYTRRPQSAPLVALQRLESACPRGPR